jgi:hypothetical protein
MALPHIVTFLRFHVWVLMLRNPSLCKFRKRHLQEVLQAASRSQYETHLELATIVASKPESNGLRSDETNAEFANHNDETNAELANQKSEFGRSLSSSFMKENLELKSEVSALKTEILELKALLESEATGLKISPTSRPHD